MDLTWVTIPRSEKARRLMNRPPPSRLSQGTLIQHFSIWLFTAKKMQLTAKSSSLPPPLGQLKWLTWVRAGRCGWGCAVRGHREQNSSQSVTLSMIRFLPFYVFSPAPSPLPSLSFLFTYSFLFLSFLIFLFLCSGIVIRHQCYSGLKNRLLFH